MDGLQAQFHSDRFDPVQFGQQGDHILRQAVRPGTHGQAHDILRRQSGGEFLPQDFHRGIGVGEGLEVRDVFAAFVFGADPGFCLFQLGGNGTVFPGGKFSAAGGGAEYAAAETHPAVPVGAGETAVDGQFIYFAAKFGPIMVIECGVHGILRWF